MDLRQLRYLVRTIESSSISRAAQSLNIAQPSLSQSLKELEAELGVALLHRVPNGVLPTETGTMVADRARAILRLADTLKQDAISAGTSIAGEVLVGLPTTMALHLNRAAGPDGAAGFPGRAPAHFGRHERPYSGVGAVRPAGCCRALHRRACRGFASGRGGGRGLCLVSRHDPGVAGDAVRFDQLVTFPSVLPGPDHGLRRSIEGAMRSARQPLTVAVEVDSLPT